MHKGLLNYVYDNKVGMEQEISNHHPVFIKIMEKNLPYCGKGLWKLPAEIIITKSLGTCQRKHRGPFTNGYNSI